LTAQMQSLLSEIDAALTTVSSARRSAMLRKLTDLLAAGTTRYSGEQLSIFDAVLRRLTRDADPETLIELSGRLASLESAPADFVGRLSQYDDIEISRPVLERSSVLSDDLLVGIAKAKSQQHLLAIAGRKQVNGPITDVLVDRGDSAVKLKAVANEGALFSQYGFARLVTDARTDNKLAAWVKKRRDIPAELQPFLRTAVAG